VLDTLSNRVAISVKGRFHAYDLAGGLHKLGLLGQLITSYPRSVPLDWGIPKEKILSLLGFEIASRLARVVLPDHASARIDGRLFDAFDRKVAKFLGPFAVVVAWSGMALHTLRRARLLGAKTVLERGSSHIRFQRQLLEDEYERWGIKKGNRLIPSLFGVEKELIEYAEADAIAVPSEFVKRSFVSNGIPESKLIHVPYGVDLEKFKPGVKGDGKFRAIFVGHLSLRKGIPDLLEAARLSDVELVLVGGIAEEITPFLRGLTKSCKLVGHIPQSRLREYYNQADVFVIASIEEGLAMVQLQALACGIPVICTHNSGGEDIVQDGINGFVVPIRDPFAIADRLIRLRENPELLQAMKSAAYQTARASLSWSQYVFRISREYARLEVRPKTPA